MSSKSDAFLSNCTSLESVTIQGNVTDIFRYAFYNCASLTSFTIPDGVTSISGAAFKECISLTSITIPNTVKTIYGSAFFNCKSLASITIPNSVTVIEEDAFKYCDDLMSVTILNAKTIINDRAFVSIYKMVFYGYKGSTAETYAAKYGKTFVPIDIFTVEFCGKDGGVIDTQRISYGNSAEAPDNPICEGYFFLGWDKEFNNVITDLVITALYDPTVQLTLNPSKIRLVQGDTKNLKLIIKPDALTDREVRWENSNPSVVSFDTETGILSGLSGGVAVITVTHNRQKVSVSCTVTVVASSEMSNEYRESIRENSRGMWDCQVTVDGAVIPKKDINKLKLMEMMFTSDKISIGSVVSSYAEIEFRNTGMKFMNKSLTFKLGMLVGGAFEYVQFGTFYVTDSEGGEEDETITITAYDSVKKTDIPYSSSLTYPATIQAVAQEISTICGVPLAETDWPEITIGAAIKAETCRDALSVLAQLLGCSVVANRKSQLEFRWFKHTDITIDASTRYYTFSRKDMDSYIRSVKIVNDNGIFTASSEPTSTGEVNGLDISVINVYATQVITDQIMAKTAMTYRAGEVDFIGDPSMTVGDVIIVKDKSGKAFSFPMMKNTMEYDGGVQNIMESYTESEEEQEFTSSKKTTEEKLNEVTSSVNDIESDLYGEYDEETGEYSGGVVDMVMGATDPETGQQVGGMLKCVSCAELPENPDSNTIYLIQGAVTVN